MSVIRDLLGLLLRRRPTGADRPAPTAARPERAPSPRPTPTASRPGGPAAPRPDPVPGPDGSATTEVDPRRVGPVHTSYHPQPDGRPDPGEIVWTWVPFEEHDGRGKDRPVLIVAALPGDARGAVLAVQLTSRNHDGDTHFVGVGAGGWDGEHRPSWVNLDRVFRVVPAGMRRESVALPRPAFDRVVARLDQLYGFSG